MITIIKPLFLKKIEVNDSMVDPVLIVLVSMVIFFFFL